MMSRVSCLVLRASCLAIACACVTLACSAAYTELYSVEASSSGKQWINTGYQPKMTDRIEMKFKLTSTASSTTLWCSRGTSTTSKSFTCFALSSSNVYRMRVDHGTCSNWSVYSDEAVDAKGPYVVVADGKSLVFSLNGVPQTKLLDPTTDIEAASALMLFASHTSASLEPTASGNYSNLIFYYLKVYDEDDNLIHHFVPACDDEAAAGSKAKYGVMDLVGETPNFRPNKGTTAALTPVAWPEGGFRRNEKGEPEVAVTMSFGPDVASVTMNGKPVADGQVVWMALEDAGKIPLTAVAADGYARVNWSVENAALSVAADGKTAELSSVTWPTVLHVAGVSKAMLDDLPVDGLVQHYDAMDLDTIITNVDGNVLEWRSKTVNFANPVVPALKGWNFSSPNAEASYPFYSATQLEGRGGIVTGRTLAGEKAGETVCTLSGLTGTVATVNRTVFFVMRPFPKLNGINRGVFFGEAGGEGSLAMNTASNNQGVHDQAGFAAFGWLWQDGYCFAQPGSPFDYTAILKSADRTQLAAAECTDAKMKSFPSFRPAIARSWQYGSSIYGHVHGAYGELVIYDRVLKQGEITYINARLRDKWLDSDIVRKRTKWIGGPTGSWNVAANWDNGLPDRDRAAVIANAAVTVTEGDSCVWDLELKDATLTLAAGAMLRVEEVTAAYASSTIAVGSGATFATDDWCEPWGAGPTVTLAGGKFVYRPRPTSVRRSWFRADDCINDVGRSNYASQDQLDCNTLETTHRSMLPKVTGTGEFCCAGAGVTELDADHLPSDGLSLTVAGGALELNGLDLKVKSLGGTAILRNSGAETVTVTVENASTARLTPRLEGAVKVVATGGGAFRHLGGGEATGGIEVDGSTLWAAADVIERDYGNPVIHLDASVPETMVTNAAGEILRWNSSDAHGQSFSVHPVTTVNKNSYTNTAPVWSATAFNGKPAALFTTTADGSAAAANQTTPAVIRSASASTNLTFFFVGRFYGNSNTGFFSFIGGAFAGSMPYLYAQSVGELAVQVWRFGANFPYALDNGKMIYDYDGGMTEAIPYSALLNRDLVLAYRAGDAVEGVYAPVIACGDQSYLQRGMCGKFCEVLVYDQRLSDETMKEISAQLMKKWGIEPSEGADPLATKGSLNSQSAITLKNGATIDLGGETNVVRKLETSGNVTVSNGALKVGALDVVLGDNGAYGAVRGDADWDIDGMALAFVGDARPSCGNVVRTSGTITGTLGPITPSAVAPRVKTSVSRIWIPGGLLLFVK